MFNIKAALSAIILTVGIASATAPATVTSLITNVQIVPMYYGPSTESSPAFFINISGNLYVSKFDSEKTKAFLDMATIAASTGKKVYLRYDPDYTLQVNTCGDYTSGGGCSYVVSTTGTVIEELAIVP
jgi:hypothetical protein